MKRLIEQVNTYADVMLQQSAFKALYSAILGNPSVMAAPEQWIVWPRAGDMKTHVRPIWRFMAFE